MSGRQPGRGSWLAWFFIGLVALAALTVGPPLVAGSGTTGIMLQAGVCLVALVALLVCLVIARLWRRGRWRFVNALRALVLLVPIVLALAVLVGGTLTVGRYFGDCADLPGDRYVCVVVCDGANLHQARRLLMEGMEDEGDYTTTISRNFPVISEQFIHNGAYTANGISVWPSSSVPAHTGIMTGAYPRHTGIMGQRQFNPSRKLHTSYIGLGISMLSKLLAAETKTLCEYFPKVRSLVVLQICNRGASLYAPTTPSDEGVVRLTTQIVEFSDAMSRYSGRNELPRIVVMTLPDIDHETHNAALNDERSVEIYLEQDKHIADIFGLYRRKGIFDRTLFVLCSDHGMEEVRNHLTIDNLMHDLRFEVYQSMKWALVRHWGSFEANFWVGRRTLFDGPYNGVSLWGGNSDALLYLRGQQKDPAGNVVSESWDVRPTDEDLMNYVVGGTTVNVIERLLDYSPGIGLIFTNPEPGVFNVYARSGRSQIRERRTGESIEFCYTVTEGDDPLYYTANPAMRPIIDGGRWLTDQRWLALTYLEHYPDALRRISHSFGNPSSGHMHISATDGWDFAPYYVAKHVLSGSHGSLNEHASLVPIMFHGPGIKTGEIPYARTVDIVPTILRYLGVTVSHLDGRALPVFEDAAINGAITAAAANTFVRARVKDDQYVYFLQRIYASYDRRLVREDRVTGECEVMVESVKEALPSLQRQPNVSLELVGRRGDKLVFRETFADQEDVEGEAILLDTGTGRFVTQAREQVPRRTVTKAPLTRPPIHRPVRTSERETREFTRAVR